MCEAKSTVRTAASQCAYHGMILRSACKAALLMHLRPIRPCRSAGLITPVLVAGTHPIGLTSHVLMVLRMEMQYSMGWGSLTPANKCCASFNLNAGTCSKCLQLPPQHLTWRFHLQFCKKQSACKMRSFGAYICIIILCSIRVHWSIDQSIATEIMLYFQDVSS